MARRKTKATRRPSVSRSPSNASMESSHLVFHFKASYLIAEGASESFAHNERLAKLIVRSFPKQDKRNLLVVPSQADQTQNAVVSVSIQIRRRLSGNLSEEDAITKIHAIRDHSFRKITADFFRTIKQRLDFYKVYAETSLGEPVPIHTKVMVCTTFGGRLQDILRSTKRETSFEVLKDLGKLVPASAWRLLKTAAQSILNNRDDVQGSVTTAANTAGIATTVANTGGTVTTVANTRGTMATGARIASNTPAATGGSGLSLGVSCLPDLAELTNELLTATRVNHTRGVATSLTNPYATFRSNFKVLHRTICETTASGLTSAAIWSLLNPMKDLTAAAHDLFRVINSSEALVRIEESHSPSRAKVFFVGACILGAVALCGGTLVVFPAVAEWVGVAMTVSKYSTAITCTSVASGIAAPVSAWRSYHHSNGLKKCQGAYTSLKRFKNAYVRLNRSLALCFAQLNNFDFSSGRTTKAQFLESFGVDLSVTSEDAYGIEHVRQAAGLLKAAFDDVVKSLEAVMKYEGASLGITN